VSIVWSQFAIEDRLQIFEYIALENPIAAIECDEAISQQVGALAQFPEIGRPGPRWPLQIPPPVAGQIPPGKVV